MTVLMELKRLPIYLHLESDSNYDGSADERNRMLVESVRSELVIF